MKGANGLNPLFNGELISKEDTYQKKLVPNNGNLFLIAG